MRHLAGVFSENLDKGGRIFMAEDASNHVSDSAEAVLGDIEHAYDRLEIMASRNKHMNPCKS